MSKRFSSSGFRRGYSLLELIVSMTAATVLLMSMSSTLFISVRATDPSTTPVTSTIKCHTAINEVLLDLEQAMSITERSANAITFLVPDRDGDLDPEIIRYAWSGTSGAPLTRQYNGGTAVTFVENVYDFQHNLPALPTNLLSNPDMEAGTANWSVVPNAVMNISSATAVSPSNSMLTDRTTTNYYGGIRQDVWSAMTNGMSFRLAAWVKGDLPAGITPIQLELRITSSGEGVQVFPVQKNILGQNWDLISGTVTPTWTGSLTSAYWQIQSDAAAPRFYVDSAVLAQASSPRQYVEITLQVGSDVRSRLQSGRHLVNAPL